MSIGEKIRRERKAAKKTQSELAALTGLALNTISRYEKGDRKPTVEALFKIADALQIPLIRLIEDTNEFDEERPFSLLQIENHALSNCYNIINRLYLHGNYLLIEHLLSDFEKLNSDGQIAAIQRVMELTEISRYTMPDDNSGDTE